MGLITGRFTRYDITSVIVSGVDITSLLTDASLDITMDTIDMNALQDQWNQREFGRADWSASFTKLATSGFLFGPIIDDRAPVGVTINITSGIQLAGDAIPTGGTTSMGDQITEACTFVCASTPTITTD